jgi:hypothetical protein
MARQLAKGGRVKFAVGCSPASLPGCSSVSLLACLLACRPASSSSLRDTEPSILECHPTAFMASTGE